MSAPIYDELAAELGDVLAQPADERGYNQLYRDIHGRDPQPAEEATE
jgi:hypothetical protein